MSDEIRSRILAEMQENRAETRRLGEKVDRAAEKADRLVAEMEDVKVRLYAVETAVVGNVTMDQSAAALPLPMVWITSKPSNSGCPR